MKNTSEKNNVRVRYNRELNRLESGELNSVEQNLFFYICSRVREHQDEIVEMSFDSIRKNANFTAHGDKALANKLKIVNHKLLSLNYEYVMSDGITIIGSIFNTFVINEKIRTLSVRVNKDLLFLLNGLEGNFTEWELREFTSIKSEYSKRLYRYCTEWKSIGNTPMYSASEMKDILGLPEDYENKKLVAKILNPACEDMTSYFSFFEMHTKRASEKGAPIVGFSFSFSPIRVATIS